MKEFHSHHSPKHRTVPGVAAGAGIDPPYSVVDAAQNDETSAADFGPSALSPKPLKPLNWP